MCVGYMHVPACLPCVKLKMWCAHTVAHKFNICVPASEHTQHTSNVRHKLTLGIPQYMCGVQEQ